jgi:membrane-bound lytic murein transglycosylase A
MRLRLGALVGLTLLAACTTNPKPHHRPYARTAPLPTLKPVELASLPGWAREDHAAAFAAYRETCSIAPAEADHRACADAQRQGRADERTARRFFEAHFRAEAVAETGLLTGYFAPEYQARRTPDHEFSAPVLPRPAELKRGGDGRFQTWRTRAEIEAAPGPALAYMRPEDLYFLQIQGSGYLDFPDGRRARAAYAADNGQPYRGIATPLLDRGLLRSDETNGDGIKQWLAAHRGREAQAITDLNPRYVFFALQGDDGGQPAGSAGIPLPVGRAVAIDRSRYAMGDLLWIDSDQGAFAGARPYQRLVVALDQGGAIKGAARADLYLGRGEAAGREAGRIKQPLRLYRLAPRDGKRRD